MVSFEVKPPADSANAAGATGVLGKHSSILAKLLGGAQSRGRKLLVQPARPATS